MSKSPIGTGAIIRQLEADANAHARRHFADVAEFSRLQRLERMQILIDDIADWLDEKGDRARLVAFGVSVHDGEGTFSLKQGRRTLKLLPRDDLSFTVDGRIMHPNRDCPTLDRRCYDEVLARLIDWARNKN